MMKRVLLAALFTVVAWPALAATCGVTSPQLKDNTGATFNAPYVDDGTGSGDCQPVIKIGTGSVNLLAGSQIIGKVGIDQTTPGTTNGVQINAALPAGTQIIGKVGIDQTTPGTTNGVQINAALPAGTNKIGTFDPATPASWGIFAAGSTTSGQSGSLIMCAASSAAPTYTTGQTNYASCDLSGNIRVVTSLAANSSVNVNQWDGTALGAPTAMGTPQTTGNVINANTAMFGSNAGSLTVFPMKAANSVSSSDVVPEVAVANAATPGPASAANSGPVTLPILNHTPGTSASLTSLVVKGSAGNLNGFNCTAISGATAGFCVAYNGTTAPSTGALTAANVLDYCYFDTTARGCSLAHINGSVAYSTGIVILVTSAATPFTYTTGTDTAAITADYD